MTSEKELYETVDEFILKSYFKPTPKKLNHYLHNTTLSMAAFENVKNHLFNFNYHLGKVDKNDKIYNFYIKGSDIKNTYPNFTYKDAITLGKDYTETLSFKVEIISLIQKTKGDNEIEQKTISLFNNEIKIPIYIGHGGVPINNQNSYPSSLEIGGYFITKGHNKKHMVFKKDRTSTWPKYTSKKYFHHISFNSVPFRFIDFLEKPQFLNIDIDYSLEVDKLDILIQSKKTLPKYNLIILIAFLIKKPIEIIKTFLISRFKNQDQIYDNKIIDIIEILFSKTFYNLNLYQENENKKKSNVNNSNILKQKLSEIELIEKYIRIHFMLFYNENKFEESEQIIYNKVFFDYLLPAVNSFMICRNDQSKISLLRRKGMTLYQALENSLISSYQESIYPDKYNLSIRRIASPGNTFENICIESVKNLIKDFKDQLTEKIKNKSLSPKYYTFNPYRKMQGKFIKIFNMQDNKHSLVVKPQKSINFPQRMTINNTVVLDSSIQLSKGFKSRDPDIVSFHYMGPTDTPDHGANVGIHRRLNVGAILNDKNFEAHKKLTCDLIDFIYTYLKENSKIKNNLQPGMVNIILVDDSEVDIGSIEQELVLDLYKQLKIKKIQQIFEDYLFEISLIPIYKYTNLKILAPINIFRSLRINIGNKILFMPAYIVENGNLKFEDINYNELQLLKHKDFDNIIKEYEIIEFLGPEEFTYSNVCENISTFKNLSLEERKYYHYVSFDNSLNLSLLESMIFDIGKMPGARGIFSSSQLKQNISTIQPDALNNLDTNKISGTLVQEPCITNDILIESRINKQGFGSHVIVAFMAYNDNIEDSIIINRSSVNNGLFLVINIQKYKGETDFSQMTNNQMNIKNYKHSYKKLDDNAVPEQNVTLEYGDALYGNTEARLKKNDNVFYLQDNSMPYKFILPGRVDRIFLTNENSTTLKILYTVVVTHYVERGHKMANQCAQKSTVSSVLESYKIPYNIDGIRPDIILNTLSKIGRKTINMFFQTILTNYFNYIPFNKNGEKSYINYKSFSDNNFLNLQSLKTNLKNNYPFYSDEKINKIFNSEETLYDPETGEVLKNDIFMGSIYFNRLTQISDEKLAVRNRGRLNKLNQPLSGKQKGGGLKFGEMENDALITHGAVYALDEISKDSIDVQEYSLICQECTNIATKKIHNNQNYYTCLNCENLGITPIFEKHLLTKTTKTLIGLFNFRGVKFHIKYNSVPMLFEKDMQE